MVTKSSIQVVRYYLSVVTQSVRNYRIRDCNEILIGLYGRC